MSLAPSEISPISRLLVVGAGSIGERHIRCFLVTGRVEVVVCDPNEELLQKVQRQYRLKNGFTQIEDALRQGDYDAALIATPAHTHIPLAQQCADQGLHLLVENPLALSHEGIDQLQQTLAQHGKLAAVAYVQRANPLYSWLKRELDTGRWGKPLQLTVNAGQHFPTFRPAYHEIYYNNRATGGGAIIDALSHMINLGEWLVGPTCRIMADADHLSLPGVEIEDTVHMISRHGDVMANYSLNQHQHPNQTFVQIVCTHGTVRAELHHGRISWVHTPCGEAEQWQINSDRDSPFIAQAENFLDMVQGRGDPLCSFDEGLQTQNAIDQVLASADSPPWFHVVHSSKITATPLDARHSE